MFRRQTKLLWTGLQELTFLFCSTGAPNFKLESPQIFFEHPLNIKEQHNRQLSGRAGNILPDD